MDKQQGSSQILRDNDTSWSRIPYQVVLGKKFTTLKESLIYTRNTWGGFAKTGSPRANDINRMPGAYTPPEWGSVEEATGLSKALYDAPTRIFYQDTRVGANDAINCFYQFNRDDDIVHPATYSETTGIYGLGRSYTNTTQRNQTIAYFSFGLVQFNNIGSFLENAVYAPLARINAAGFDRAGMFNLGQLFGTAASLAFGLVFIPIRMFKAMSSWLKTSKVSKYIEFRSEMASYYSYADSICAQWLVATGMYGNGKAEPAKVAAQDDANSGFFSRIINKIVPGFTASKSSLPPGMAATGPSIFHVLGLRARILGFKNMGAGYSSPNGDDKANAASEKSKQLQNMNSNQSGAQNIQDVLNARTKPSSSGEDPVKADAEKWSTWSGECIVPSGDSDSGMSQFANTFSATSTGITQFIGFRIEKSTDSSESFGNSTGPSKLADLVNNKIKSAYDKAVTAQLTEAQGASKDDSLLGDVQNFFNGALNSISTSLGSVETLASTIRTGSLIDIPDEYTGSEYNKSFSISLQLRSPYGDINSIYNSIIIPLSLLLAGSLPRSAGEHAYQSPFVLRAYCAGRFSIPLGIIENVSITRGSSDFGWTYQNLPTCMDITLSIKDLSPCMYMALRGTGLFDKIMGDDSTFTEYINTLAGVGLAERVNSVLQAQRNVQLRAHNLRNKYFNPNYWANGGGDSAIGQFVGLFINQNTIPRS